ncbi:MAG TPA: CAP domain-containing protein [Thermoleophilaceae bacterium]|nr:CAP domain-containing protein [Thermoleophilaceae bacterium]
MGAVAVLVLVGWALGPPSASQAGSAQKEMVRAVNGARADHGLKPLHSAPRLECSARAYARWMLRANYFGHQSRIRTRARFRVLGETLAWHSGRRARVRRTLRAWLHSPPHRALILSGRFGWIGAGTASGRLAGRPARTWVLHLGG